MTPKIRILLGVTGGIAAYKSPDLVRRLMERGAEVQVVMTDAAQKFITPMSFQAVSGRPARVDLWDGAAEAGDGVAQDGVALDGVGVALASPDGDGVAQGGVSPVSVGVVQDGVGVVPGGEDGDGAVSAS